jgi:hypothetical protein
MLKCEELTPAAKKTIMRDPFTKQVRADIVEAIEFVH